MAEAWCPPICELLFFTPPLPAAGLGLQEGVSTKGGDRTGCCFFPMCIYKAGGEENHMPRMQEAEDSRGQGRRRLRVQEAFSPDLAARWQGQPGPAASLPRNGNLSQRNPFCVNPLRTRSSFLAVAKLSLSWQIEMDW